MKYFPSPRRKLINITSFTWRSVAKFLNHYDPKYLILIACEAGGHLPAMELFDGVPILQTIFGPVVSTTEPQAGPLYWLVPYLLRGVKLPKKKDRQLWQLLFGAITGSPIYVHTRGEKVGLEWIMLDTALQEID